MARGSIDNTNVSAPIAVAQSSIVCYLKHCSSIGEVACSEVSVSDSNSTAIGEEPVSWCMRGVAGGAVNTDSTISVERRV